MSLASFQSARADATLERVPIQNAPPVLLLKGEFSLSDNPAALAREVAATGAKAITFNSNGGNVVSAMAYGRMIRSLGLATFQLRAAQCASACTLAFLGGVIRQAEPGSVGVHQSSFSPESGVEGRAAVAAVQTMTAEIMTYLIEMGVDPKLLQLSLSVPSDDMRYLTAAEMAAYRVTAGSMADVSQQLASPPPASAAITPAPPAKPETPARTPEDKAKALTAAYYDAWSRRNSDAMASLERLYATTVDFYGKPTAGEAVMEQKRDFGDRWPVRAYSARIESLRVTCSGTCRVDGSVDWYARRESGDRVSSGTAEFSLTWDTASGQIVSEAGKVVEMDKGLSSPHRLISQWQAQNTACRGGSGDSPETITACDRREVLGAKLKAVGWCYGREGEAGYQMDWHACGSSAGQDGAASTQAYLSASRPSPTEYRVHAAFTGKTVLPDFKGRDRDFNTFRTRIRDGMLQGPNFAGHYTVIQIGCGTGCSFAIVADNLTGRPLNFPRGGENNMYLDLDYRRDSRLLSAQWLDYDQHTCFVEFFAFDGGIWKQLSKAALGNDETCLKPIRENLR
ncbi:hypothetical protein [Rhizobium oryzicola]|uniref:Uncharacterized protein n=1 Tax=Rhizobium oryzicola TaxID=1232668 RepID=A0ABT8T4A6_9HYPH|nr:hypothetical protein [Rhizobium oryzicola]MDO1585259.1 hypothetical protein [Rhizobium oryzicola]